MELNKLSVKKTPNTLNTEELIELLDEKEEKVQQEEPSEINYKNDVLTFISVFNIQDGEDNIKPHTLYSIYRVWSKEPISKTAFFLTTGKFLTKKDIYYKINQNAIKLTHEAYRKFKEEKKNAKLKSKFWTNHFEDFLLYYSLKGDDFWIEAPLLYFIYDKYTHVRGLDKNPMTYMGKTVFSTYADIFLKYKNTKYGRMYLVSSSILNQFQPEQYQRMKEAHEKEVEESLKPKKSKRKRRTRKKIQPKKQG